MPPGGQRIVRGAAESYPKMVVAHEQDVQNEGCDEYDACGWVEGVLDVGIRYSWVDRIDRIEEKNHNDFDKAEYLMSSTASDVWLQIVRDSE